MSVKEMRDKVAEVYGDSFVKLKSDKQIVAIYYSLFSRKKIKNSTYDPYKHFKRFD